MGNLQFGKFVGTVLFQIGRLRHVSEYVYKTEQTIALMADSIPIITAESQALVR
jgi:hypothetical protein